MVRQPMVVQDYGQAKSRKQITIQREDLNWACAEGLISDKQADGLWKGLVVRAAGKSSFDMANVLWYFGAVIVMMAMGWFLVQVWDLFNGGAILATTIIYCGFFLVAGWSLWQKDELKVPGGLLVTLGVFMVPLIVYGAQRLFGVWEWQEGNQLVIEVATIIAGLVALNYVRFPFITAPLSVAIWFLGIDGINFLWGDNLGWHAWRIITLCFGIIMLTGSLLVDRRFREDFAFWGYLIGATTFWISLSLIDTSSEMGRFFSLLINVGLMLISVLLGRRVFLVYGAMGVIWYLGYLAFSVFADSMMFPIVLSLMGLLVIWVGIKYHQNRERIEKLILSNVPESLRAWLPTSRQ